VRFFFRKHARWSWNSCRSKPGPRAVRVLQIPPPVPSPSTEPPRGPGTSDTCQPAAYALQTTFGMNATPPRQQLYKLSSPTSTPPCEGTIKQVVVCNSDTCVGLIQLNQTQRLHVRLHRCLTPRASSSVLLLRVSLNHVLTAGWNSLPLFLALHPQQCRDPWAASA